MSILLNLLVLQRYLQHLYLCMIKIHAKIVLSFYSLELGPETLALTKDTNYIILNTPFDLIHSSHVRLFLNHVMRNSDQ
jgi:hypothetical protein